MALRREQLYFLKSQGPTDTTYLATSKYYGGSPLCVTASGVRNLVVAAGAKEARGLIGVAVNSSTEDAKYGAFTPYIVGPCVLALYDGATSPFIAGPGSYAGPGNSPAGGAEVYGPYGLGTGLTAGEGKPFAVASEDAVGAQNWVIGSEVSICTSATDTTTLGKWTSNTTNVGSTKYAVGRVKSVVTGGGTATTTPDIVEIQFYGSVQVVP